MNTQYVEKYQSLVNALPGQQLLWLNALRQAALGQFAASGFPSPREEEWKYTNVTALEKKLFQPSLASAAEAIDAAWLNSHKLADAWILVLLDGRFEPGLSVLAGLPDGVLATGLAEALRQCPDRVQSVLGSALPRESHGFLAFNTAYFSDGAFLCVSRNVVLDRPVQILHVSSRDQALANTRSLVDIQAHAEAKLVETFVGVAGLSSLTAAVTEIRLADNAGLVHYKAQMEADRTYHFGGVYANQGRGARFTQHNLSFGAMLARNEIHADLAQGGECELNGLFLATGRQHMDNHTLIHHREPHGTSRETYRGVLADRARGVFQGRIVVHPKAQKTSAEMGNRNLLLSEDAEIDAKPQLEILADDVKCSHGVAIGQLDPESVFYLVSRGVDRETARNMLTFAFANEMVAKIGLDSLRVHIQEQLLNLFPQTGMRRDWL